MENKKNNAVLLGIIFLTVGILLGWLIWASGPQGMGMMQGRNRTHIMMQNGASDGMDMMMTDMNASLRGKSGDAFDREFIAQMIVHHQGAIDMARLALAQAEHQEIKDLAEDIISAQTREIGQMEAWQASWYK